MPTMQEFLTTPAAKALLWVTVLLVMLAIGYTSCEGFGIAPMTAGKQQATC